MIISKDKNTMILFKQIKTKEQQPPKCEWHNTDKGLLFYWKEEEQWSCRDDKISEEHPTAWYEEVTIEEKSRELTHEFTLKLTDEDYKNLKAMLK